jgi:parvulin-like peptidyl-prolyl isomerase
MRSRSRGLVLGSFGLALGLAGCSNTGAVVARDGARPHADQILADAPALLPPQPPAAEASKAAGSSVSRLQKPDAPVTPASLSSPAAATGQTAVRIRASVNGLAIYDDEVRESTAQHLGEVLRLPPEQRSVALQQLTERELDKLIERELVLEEAFARLKEHKLTKELDKLKEAAGKESDKRLRDVKAALKLKTDDELKAVLQQQGLTVDGMRRQVERSFIMMEYVRNLVYPVVNRISLQQLRDYYEAHADEFRVEEKLQWLDVFIDASRFPDPATARRFAEQVAAKARAGEDFAKLVKQYDNGDSSLRNGLGLGEKRGEVRPAEAEAVLFALKSGEVGPVIDLGFGFHVVKVTEHQYGGQKPFDAKTQGEVRRKLQNIIADREYKRIVDELKRKATVRVYE